MYEVAIRGVADYEVTEYEVAVFCFSIVIFFLPYFFFLSVQYLGKKWLICRVSDSVTSPCTQVVPPLSLPDDWFR